MKILYLITKSESGGAQTHVFQLARGFKEGGHQVAIMSYPGGWLEGMANELGVKFYPNKKFSNSFNPWKISLAMKIIDQAIADFKPDIIHCHSSMAGIAGRLAAKKHRVPVIFTAHGWSFNEGVPWLQKLIGITSEKIGAYFCFKIISVADFVTNLGLKYHVAPKDKFTTIYNGIELSEGIVSKPEEKIRIILVARLAEPKDPILFLSAFNSLDKNIKDLAKITIVGDGPKFAETKKFLEINNLTQYVEMTGEIPREKVFPLLAESHIFVLPSKWEGFPYTVIEAMNYGLACLASDVGGIKEALSNGCGLIVSNDLKVWAEALNKLLTNKELINDMGRKARARTKEMFSQDMMLKKIETLYHEAINDGNLKR